MARIKGIARVVLFVWEGLDLEKAQLFIMAGTVKYYRNTVVRMLIVHQLTRVVAGYSFEALGVTIHKLILRSTHSHLNLLLTKIQFQNK